MDYKHVLHCEDGTVICCNDLGGTLKTLQAMINPLDSCLVSVGEGELDVVDLNDETLEVWSTGQRFGGCDHGVNLVDSVRPNFGSGVFVEAL